MNHSLSHNHNLHLNRPQLSKNPTKVVSDCFVLLMALGTGNHPVPDCIGRTVSFRKYCAPCGSHCSVAGGTVPLYEVHRGLQ